MKKSTILLLLVVYVVSFFLVGLLGVSIRSNYILNYVNEITVELMEDQPNIRETKHERVDLTENADEEHKRYENTYNFFTRYQENLIIKFRVKVLPVKSTYSNFTFTTKEDEYIEYEIKDETLIYITYKARGTTMFTLESQDGNKTQTTVTVTAL